MREIGSVRHWTAAILVAMAAHAALLPMLITPEPPGAVSAGVGGIELSLGPTGGAPGAATPVTATEAGGAPVPADAREVTPETATAVATATPPPQAKPAEAVPVTPVAAPPERPVEVAQVEPVTAPPERPIDVAKVEPVAAPPERPVDVARVEPPPPPRPKPPEPVRTKPVQATPPKPVPPAVTPPVEVAKPAPVTPAPATRAAAQTLTTAAVSPPGPVEPTAGAAPAGAAGRSGAQTTPAAGSGTTASGGGAPGTTADYLALLQAWLERHKEYPQRARFRRIEGTAVLYFMMDREGRVLNFDIRRSSGSSILDEAVTAMIRRADPLPAMPNDMPDTRLELVVPIQFQIR